MIQLVQSKKRYVRLVLSLSAALVVCFVIALCVGRYSSNPLDVLNAFVSKISGTEGNQAMENVVFVIRVPRIFAAMLIGAVLSLSGSVYQGVFQNPLVSPDLLGVSSGACVGAAGAILLGLGIAERQLFAFAGGMAAVIISVAIPKMLRNSSNMMLVLSGIITSGLMTSLLGIMKFIAEEDTELSAIVFWQMGSLGSVNAGELFAVAPVLLVCAIIIVALSWRINILSFGETEAKTLGLNIKLIRGVCVICASLMTASAVSISGTIGWIGLVIPHLGRLMIGPDNTRLMPVTILSGALFMLVVDTIARTATTMEIPLSILTGLVGAPLYAWLLYKQRARVQ